VLPTAAAIEWLGAQARLVPHLYGGSPAFQAVLFGATALAALAMLVGWRTRLATLATWLLVASMQARNPTLNAGGDNLLRIMLFWAMLVPLGARWSIDQARRGGAPAQRITSVATFAIQMQLCLMYWFTAVLKWDPAWIGDFTAVEMALSVDHLTTSFGRLLLAHPDLLRALTAFTMGLEILGPLLVWSPVRTGPLRFLVVLGFVAFHLVGLGPTMHLGLFPWVCAVTWLMFLPTWMWERLESEHPGAFGRIDRLLRGLASRFPEPHRRPSEVAARLGARLSSVLAGLLLLFVLAWNLITLDRERHARLTSSAVGTVVRSAGLGQRWAMFAPHPPEDDGWYVMPGRTAGGREVDVWRSAPREPVPVDWAKPRDVAATLRSKHWNKYLMNLSLRDYRYHRPLFGDWLCRTWNRDHEGDERLLEFSMIFLLERFAAPRAEPEPLVLWVQECEPSS
jgi:hypothetical protein